MNSNKERILVTGGAGFIGSHLVDALIAKGARVAVLDNLSTGRRELVHPKADFYELDMNSTEAVAAVARFRPRVLFHLAFNSNVPRSVQDPLFDALGISGSINMFQAAAQHGAKRIVLASSAFVYGNTSPALFPVNEQHPAQPVSPYAISKSAVEHYLRYFAHIKKVSAVILRYSTVYGPRQVTGAMADYIRTLADGRRAEIYGAGPLTRDYVYVDDVVRANLLALDYRGTPDDAIFNIGSSQEVALDELHRRIGRLLGSRNANPIRRPGRKGDIIRFCVSNAKARHALGWEPTISFDEGLRRTVSAATGRKLATR